MLTPNWARWPLAMLAVYRLARLIAIDEGPFAVFQRLRARLGAYDMGPDARAETVLGRGIACPLCVGVYAALLALMLLCWPTRLGDLLLAWLGLAGGQTFLQGMER